METESNSKKGLLEDLPKDELIKKCKGLLNILQKAKQSKDSLVEENSNLKEKLKTCEVDSDMLESLIQQKIQLVTTLEEVKSQKKVLENRLQECESNLTGANDRIVSLDNENEGCRKQINRLVEENEQLLTRLDSLEKETDDLKNIGLKQQEQLLKLEDVSLKHADYENLQTKLEKLEVTHSEVQNSSKELSEKNQLLSKRCDELNSTVKLLEGSNEGLNHIICELKKTIDGRNENDEDLKNEIYKLTTELHTQKCFNEQLQSHENSELQDINDKLKDKLKLFHSKLVKFASDVKFIKQEKTEVLDNFKAYVLQVKAWEKQLEHFSSQIIDQFKEFECNKSQFALEYDSLKIKFDSMEKENSVLNSYNKELANTVANLKLQISSEKLHSDNKLLTERLNNVIQQIQEFKTELDALKCERNLLNEQYRLLLGENDREKEQNHVLKVQNAALQRNLQQQTSELESHSILKKNVDNYKIALEQIEIQLSETTKNNSTLTEKLEQLERELLRTEEESTSHQMQLVAVKKENNELLAEMNEMNQELKERGEEISKQQGYCEELLKNVKLFESQSKKHLEMVSNKEFVIKKLQEDIDALKNSALTQVVPVDNTTNDVIFKKNEEINSLQYEVSILKEKLLHSHDASQYAESDTLSTSTISRAEDVNRLKDLDGSWEERYGKLRVLAVKLKGKVQDLTEQLTREQNEKNDLQIKLTNSHKTVQTLQTQCDLLHDSLDNNKVELMGYSKQLDIAATNKSTHLKNLANNEEIIARLKAEVEALIQEKSATDSWKKQVSGKVQNLKKELDANLLVKKQFEDDIKKLNTVLDEKNKLLNDEIEKHTNTKNVLNELNNECKKQAVLTLELQDYERTMKEFTQKLNQKEEKITGLLHQVEQQKNNLNSLQEQNRLLDERLQSEDRELSNARGELQTYKKHATDLEAVIVEKDENIVHITRTLENSRTENEELSTHLTKIVADNQKSHESLKNDKHALHMQNSGLEMKVREISDVLKIKNEELAEVHKEYEAYKVRAQSVLRSSQVRDVGLEEKLVGEVASLHSQVQTLTLQIIELQTLSDTLKKENSVLQLEKEDIASKWKDAVLVSEQQKQLHDLLSTKHQNTVLENSETISSLKVHADTLSQCYRQQLSEQELRHNKEIIELQSKIEKIAPIVDTPTLISPSTPREQGEGSECTDWPKTKANHPLPLDKLLNSEVEQDVGFLRKQITEHEMKVSHLTSLLADTEQDLVKHVQMNKLLKEEIRRHQRSIEREKHAENLEYLKNVVFKFVTLTSGDERSRLVPVLNTILKFSPEESNRLNLVARGEVASRGWSDYIPVWSSGKP